MIKNFKELFVCTVVVLVMLTFSPQIVSAVLGDHLGVLFDTSDSSAGINISSTGITVYNDFFWIVDSSDAEVYKYNLDGTYTGTSFDTAASGAANVRAITFGNDFFWITDTTDDEVYKYNPDGTYTGVSFDTAASGNGFATGIAFYNDFFWITDAQDHLVYKYNSDGTYTSNTFDTLIVDNENPGAIEYYENYFWIINGYGKIEQYETDGTYVGSFDTSPGGGFGLTIYDSNFLTINSYQSGHQNVHQYEGPSPADSTDPTVSTFSPTDGEIGVVSNSNLVITFDEAVDVETGTIVIKKSSDDSIFETIDVTSGLVTGTGTTSITINPSSDLDENSAYYVQIDATAFDDAAGNSFAGIADATTWNFGEDISTSSSGSRRSSLERIAVIIEPSLTEPGNSETTPAGCQPGYNYSPDNGMKCPVVYTTSPSTLPTPNLPACILALTLKQGSTGAEVKCLQSKLNIIPDGIFGPITKASVISFQTLKNLVPDGIVGPVTREELNK